MPTRKKILFLSVFALVFHAHGVVFAQMSLSKREVREKVDAKIGATGSVVVENLSKNDTAIKAYMEDAAFASPFDAVKGFLPAGSGASSCSPWVTVHPSEFVLKSGEKKTVSYAIKAPEGARGSCSGALIFERQPLGAAGALETGVDMVVRTACLFFLETADAEHKADFGKFSFKGGRIEGSLSNTGTAFLIGRGSFYFMDEKSVVADRGELKKIYLPPGETAPLSIKIEAKIPAGTYLLVVSFDFGSGHILTAEAHFQKSDSGDIAILEKGA